MHDTGPQLNPFTQWSESGIFFQITFVKNIYRDFDQIPHRSNLFSIANVHSFKTSKFKKTDYVALDYYYRTLKIKVQISLCNFLICLSFQPPPPSHKVSYNSTLLWKIKNKQLKAQQDPLYNIQYSPWKRARAGNSLIGFLSKSLIFGEQPERFAHDRSFPLSNLSESLMVAHFWWATWAICSHRSFLVSDLSDLLTSLIKKEGMSNSLIS